MNIEVEKRAIVDKETLHALAEKLSSLGAKDLNDDDTETIFYLTDEWQAKVQRKLSKDAEAKIAWKSGGNDGSAQRREIELPFDARNFDTARQIIAAIAPQAQVFETVQRRHDYSLDGVGIALKYSDDWKYHVEFDMVINDSAKAEEAGRLIEEMAAKLGVTLLTADEEKAFVNKKIEERSEDG